MSDKFLADGFKFLDISLRGNKYNCWSGSIKGLDRQGKEFFITYDGELFSPRAAANHLLAKLEHYCYTQNNPGVPCDDLDPDLDPEDLEEDESEYYEDDLD